jgi:hypothetical protein
MVTLTDAQTTVQRLHALVEQMALAERKGQNTSPMVQSLRRAAPPLVGMLKAQFGAASDAAAQVVLVASRGGMNEKARIRTLREGVAALRAQLEIAALHVHQKHATVSEERGGTGNE